jgi:hypothetical protein
VSASAILFFSTVMVAAASAGVLCFDGAADTEGAEIYQRAHFWC